jgi:septal ring factor EnvC (AmiA/AmiB activator)
MAERLPVLFAAILAALALPVALGQASKQAPKRENAEAELATVRAQIERIRARVEKDQIERDRLTRELRSTEMSVGSARGQLEQIRRERIQTTARRAELASERDTLERSLAQERAALAGQLRAAHLVGQEEPLRLLLSQNDPARAARMLAYYSYFGRARSALLTRIDANMQGLRVLDGQLEAAQERLLQLESEQEAQVAQLEQSRRSRGRVLAQLEQDSGARQRNLQRLRTQQAGLEKLLRDLQRALEQAPANAGAAFARLRGKLAWPVAGKLVARFGEARAGALKWDGVLVAAERSAAVRAVGDGRVAYADWLPGLGLLAIIDHGEGYLTLYGHNERLYKGVGERVTAGETIAAAGDSGGRTRPELYFEIRKSGKPLDPRPWFRSPVP